MNQVRRLFLACVLLMKLPMVHGILFLRLPLKSSPVGISMISRKGNCAAEPLLFLAVICGNCVRLARTT